MFQRLNLVSIILGARGSGKTWYLKNVLLPRLIKRGKKILIIDTIDHPDYRDIPIMDLSKLHLWKSGVFRVWCKEEDMCKLNSMLNSLDNIWNTTLIYEDAGKHTADGVDKFLRALIGDSKQKNIDIIFMFWAWMEIPIKILSKTNFIECFKTADSPESRKEKLNACYNAALAIWKSVIADANKYAHKLIDTGI